MKLPEDLKNYRAQRDAFDLVPPEVAAVIVILLIALASFLDRGPK